MNCKLEKKLKRANLLRCYKKQYLKTNDQTPTLMLIKRTFVEYIQCCKQPTGCLC